METIGIDEKLSRTCLAEQINNSFALAGCSFRAVANDDEVGIYRGEKKLYNFLPFIESENISITLDNEKFSLTVKLFFLTGCTKSFKLSISDLEIQNILFQKLGYSSGMVISNGGVLYFNEIIRAIALGHKERIPEYLFTGFNQDGSEYVISSKQTITATTPTIAEDDLHQSLNFIITCFFNVLSKPKAIILFCILMVSLTKSIFLKIYHLAPNFVAFLYGATGSLKSSLARVIFCLFSPDKSDIGFDSSYAAFDSMLKSKRDITCLFDDFRIGPIKSENTESLRKLELLLRTVGDNGGGRTKCVGQKAQNVICECMPVATGEVLSSELRSSAARIFAMEIDKHEVDLDHLTAIQKNPHHLQTFIKSYLQYVITNPSFIDESVSYFKNTRHQLRSSIKDIHGRHIETSAWIFTGFHMLLSFVKESRYFPTSSIDQLEAYGESVRNYLSNYLKMQSILTGSRGRLGTIFQVLSILFANGEINFPKSFYAAGSKARCVDTSQTTVGFCENKLVYLNTDKISNIVQDYLIRNGKSDHYFSAKEFRSLLKENNLIDLKQLTTSNLTIALKVNYKRNYYTPVMADVFFDKLKEGEQCE